MKNNIIDIQNNLLIEKEKNERKNEMFIEKSEEIINELTVELVNKYFSPEFINRIDEVRVFLYTCL